MFRDKTMGSDREMVDILRALVRENTTQPVGNETVLVHYLESLFAPYADRFEKTVVSHSDVRSTLILRIGPDVSGGLAFIGHLDTVAAGDESKWTYPPFDAVEVDGLVHGRGSLDMKAGVAAMTSVALAVLRSDKQIKKPLYMCFAADEEKGGLGANALRELRLLDKVDGVLIPEPTDNKIAVAEKGVLWLRLTVQGRLAHGSKPEAGLNAVEAALHVATKIKQALASDRTHPLLGHQTCAITSLQGGVMTNVIPDQAVVEFDIRTLPGQRHDDLLEQVRLCMDETRQEFRGVSIDLDQINDHKPVDTKANDPFVALVQEAAGKLSVPTDLCGMTYFTDAGRVIPAIKRAFVIMGPGYEGMAHQVNEAVRIGHVDTAKNVYLRGHCPTYASRRDG